MTATVPATSPYAPLAGIRVIDISVVWAGPFLTQMLADLGAEVIKVENIHAWQLARGGQARPHKEEAGENSPFPHGFPNHDPGDRPWERDPWFIPLLRNKKSVTINLLNDRGQEYFHRLVAKSDVLWENNVPSTPEKLGITWEVLNKVNPRLIMLRSPAFGLDSRYKNRRGFGLHIEAFIGHTMLRGYTDMDPSSNTDIYTGDYHTATVGAFAIMAALHHRDRTGRGQWIELAQAENSTQLFPQALMDYVLNGRVQTTIGNHDVQGYAPNGVYPCTGDDRWIAITVCTDDQWRALCAAMGRAELASDPRYATTAAREQHQDELDAMLAAWTADKDQVALMERLQSAGVPAGAVMDGRDALASPQLRARDFWERIEHKFTGGTWDWSGPPFRLPLNGHPPSLPPPGLGEHNEYVYKEILGVSDAEYDDLVAANEIGVEFDASIP